MNSPNDDRFDELLRRQLDFEPRPIEGGWDKLRARLPRTPRTGATARLRPFGAGLVVGALLWWGGGQLTTHEAAPVGDGVTTVPVAAPISPTTIPTAPVTVPAAPAAISTSPVTVPSASATVPSASVTVPTSSVTLPSASATGPSSAVRVPTPSITVPSASVSAPTAQATVTGLPGAITGVAVTNQPPPTAPVREPAAAGFSPSVRQIVVLDTAIRRATAATDPGRAARLGSLLMAQTAALQTLQHQLDSLKQALPEVPAALAGPASDSARPAPAWPQLPAPRSPWAAVMLLETTPSWSTLPAAGPGVDQERTQASLAQSLQVQRQLGNRWRVRAGFGQAALRTQARYTSARTLTTTTRDSVTTTQIKLHAGTRWVRIINTNTGDTTFAQISTYDTIVINSVVRTLRTTTLHDQRQQLLRPDYRFWTLPVSLHYLALNRPRWSLALSAGAQATIFRGGTRPVWNGEEYALQRVGPRDGPYRPVSLSFSGGLEAQYRLSAQWSALLAPTVRWWALQPSKGGAVTRSVLPALQVGLTYGF